MHELGQPILCKYILGVPKKVFVYVLIYLFIKEYFLGHPVHRYVHRKLPIMHNKNPDKVKNVLRNTIRAILKLVGNLFHDF